ncbi:hypothetical protein BHE90_015100 [Fusarium euwallaceae]|uniref:C2H2-type domain-containing protein n=2 Tax=Fusarium solani species complex TaxID=232080 RepID=A0A3M2RDM0_9HYPO|nr:hypothetical protein CDV36_015051 [Fusarium kuroshium]RTE70509.1 hypothetical protein BHE90_015100 [Fusarium euwallaceae]
MDPSGGTLEWTPGTDQRRSPPSPRPRSAHPSSRAPSVASSYGSIDSGVSHPPRAGSKRKRRVDITWSEFDDFSKDGDESKARKRAREEEADVKKLSCPFYKRNPQEFKQHRTCVGPGWTSVYRVKEHIFRRHGCPEFQCHRCYDEFTTETALHDHQRADDPCEKKKPVSVSGRINAQQEEQMRSRKIYQKSLDEGEKWKAVYKIIFPDDEIIPSPYFDSGLPVYSPKLSTTELKEMALNSEVQQWLQSPVSGALGEWPPDMYEACEIGSKGLKEWLPDTHEDCGIGSKGLEEWFQSPVSGALGEWPPDMYEACGIGSKGLEEWFSDTFGHYEEEYGKRPRTK